MDSKKRAQLRAQANSLETIVSVGKGGLNENLFKAMNDALTARELVKGRALDTSPESAAECANALAGELGAEVVQVIGTRFVLYRYNPELHKPQPTPRGATPYVERTKRK